jgi:hypothetical protein
MLRRQELIGCTLLAMTVAWPSVLSAADAEAQKPQAILAYSEVDPGRVNWLPQIDYERLALTVSGPGDRFIRREFEAGKPVFLSLFDSEGNRLPDGSYVWELRAVAKKAGQTGGQPQRPPVLSGYFAIQDGSFVAKTRSTSRQAPKSPPGGITLKDLIESGNLIVKGRGCIGSACGNSDANVDALKLKVTHPNILFDETGTGAPGGATFDWALESNPSDVDRFSIASNDGSSVLTPFTLTGGAPDNSLFVAANGNLGIGTATPANHLHVLGSAGTNKVLIEEASGTTTPREILEVRNNGGAVLIYKDTSVPQRWSNGTLGGNFFIDEQAHSGIELSLTNTGNLTVAGTVTQGSSRDLKTGFASLDPKEVLARVSALPVSLWSYKTESAVRHVGPMAEDFHQAFGLGADDKHIAPGDQAGVALLAVQGLNQVVQDKAQEIATLRQENADLAKRVEVLEALLSAMQDKQSSPAP